MNAVNTEPDEILVVDDSPESLKLLGHVLSEAGYRVRLASDGELALRSARIQPPALVLLDIKMPGMDGYEVCRRLKDDEKTRSIPVVFVSGLRAEPEKVKAFDVGGVDFINKPIRASDVISRVRRHLTLYQAQKLLEGRNIDLESAKYVLEESVRQRSVELELANKKLQQQIDVHLQTLEALRKSELNYRRIVDTANEGIWALGKDGATTFVNARMAQMLGYSAEEMNGRPMTDFMFEEDAPDVTRRLGSLRLGLPERYEGRFRCKDGRTVWTLASATPVFDDKKHFDGSFVMFTDITGRKLVEDEIIKLNRELEKRVADRTAQLEAANKDLKSFAYSVSHDLRTPLRAIDGFSKILLEDYKDRLDEDGLHCLNAVRTGAVRMGQLIDDILSFSRISRQEIQMVEVNMSALARQVFDELRALEPERNICLRLAELPFAYGDQTMIRQVLANLIGNAVKFTGKRAEALIEIGGSVEGAVNVYYVKDNGAGFDMGSADKLFGVFQRLHSSEEFEGTGVGLAIVKCIVDRHGGRVWAVSTLGEGTTVHFSLPAMRQEE